MAHSLRKLVGAAARLGGRGRATLDDVLLAERMLRFKVEILSWLCREEDRVQPLKQWRKTVQKADERKERRFQEMLLCFGGRGEVRLREIAQRLECSERTIERELRARGLAMAGGMCRVPTVADYELLLLQREQGLVPQKPPEEEEDLSEYQPDCLKAMPLGMRPVVRAMDNMDVRQRQPMAERLYEIALGEIKEYTIYQLRGMFGHFNYKVAPITTELRQELERRLLEGDAQRRSLFAIELYAATRLPDMHFKYKARIEEKAEALGPEVRAAFAALEARLAQEKRTYPYVDPDTRGDRWPWGPNWQEGQLLLL